VSSPPGRPFRISMLVALASGLVLVALPLYVLRKPRVVEARPDPVAVPNALATSSVSGAPAVTGTPASNGVTASNAPAALPGSAVASAATAAPVVAPKVAAPKPVVELTPWRMVGCHDPGSKRTRPEECDHITPIEEAVGNAIASTGDCLPDTVGGGTIEYLADFSFARKRDALKLATPRGARSVKNGKAVAACKAAVRQALSNVPLPPVTHAHARYAMAITAVYPPAPGMAAPASSPQGTFFGGAVASPPVDSRASTAPCAGSAALAAPSLATAASPAASPVAANGITTPKSPALAPATRTQ